MRGEGDIESSEEVKALVKAENIMSTRGDEVWDVSRCSEMECESMRCLVGANGQETNQGKQADGVLQDQCL